MMCVLSYFAGMAVTILTVIIGFNISENRKGENKND